MKLKFVSLITIMTMLLSLIPVGSIFADTGITAGTTTQLIVHYHRMDGSYKGNIEASSFAGQASGVVTDTKQVPGTVSDMTTDEYGLKMTFTFQNSAPDAYIGLTVNEDSAFAKDKRYVRSSNGVAEVWLIDGDARVYNKPQAIDSGLIVKKNNKDYVAVEDLTGLLNLTYKYGKNTYLFDGLAPGYTDILTINHDRDYFEIDVDRNKIGSNVTGNMITNYTNLVFNNVDGFKQNNKYYLSLGYIERLFQVATLSVGNNEYLMQKQFAAYDQLTNAASPEQVGFSTDKLNKLDDYIKQQVQQGFPGAAYSIVKDGKIVKEAAFGYAKKYDTPLVNGVYQPAQLLPQDQWEPATVDTMYDLASNTKMYATNYAIQKLLSEGKLWDGKPGDENLGINTPISSFPGWENYKDSSAIYTGKWTSGKNGMPVTPVTGKQDVTIKDLLHHVAGNIPDPEYPNKTSAGALWYQDTTDTNRTGIIDVICKTPLMYKPETTFVYSDVDFMILGILAEQITGMPLDQYVENNIYNKLGISHTVFNPLQKGFIPSQIAATELNGNTRDGNVSFGTMDDGITPVYMRKYTLQGQVQDEKAYYSMGGVSGHAGLFSTVGDMAVLTQLMLNGGIYNGTQFFTKEVHDQFITPINVAGTYTNTDSSDIGLGWFMNTKSASNYYYFNWGPSRSTYGHEGWTGTLTIIDPVYNMTITILTNLRHSPVVTPPNTFEGNNYPIGNMVPISAMIYNALTYDKTNVDQPTGLSAAAKGASTIGLTWDAVSGADGYNIYRSTTQNGTYDKVNSNLVTENTFVDTTSEPGRTYYYKVASEIGNTQSEFSAYATAKISPQVIIKGVEDGKAYVGGVTPLISVDGGTFNATLDGNNFTSGTTVSQEGKHTLFVTIEDLDGNTSTTTVNFTVVTPPLNVERLAGPNRIETSIAIAKEQYTDKKPDAVVLATASNFPDSLAGSGLAYKYNAPLLLVNKSVSSSKTVLDYITTNLNKNKNIYILGGTGAVSKEISDYLTTKGYKIIRLGGKDRYETNQKIVSYLNITKGTSMVIATGNDFADALSVASIADINGFPILLNGKDSLSANASSYITNIKPTTVYVIGGTGALSANIETQVKKLNGNIKIVRLGGKDRYETSMMILDYFNLPTTTITVATGINFPDALSGSVIAARKDAGVLLVDNKDVTKQKELLSKEKITNVIIFGGEGVISSDIANSLIQK